MKEEDMIVRMVVPGARNQQEYDWANKVGMGSYRWLNKMFVHPAYTKVYNKVWDWIDKPKKGEWDPDKHPNYVKLYFRILNQLIKPVVLFRGGYNFKTHRKVTVNYDYYMVPVTDDDKRVTHEFENFLDVKDFGR